METFLTFAIPVLLILLLIRIISLPMKLLAKIAINSLCGFICLWLLNSIAGFTGFYFPINLITTLIVGILGLPGIILLGVAQFLL